MYKTCTEGKINVGKQKEQEQRTIPEIIVYRLDKMQKTGHVDNCSQFGIILKYMWIN